MPSQIGPSPSPQTSPSQSQLKPRVLIVEDDLPSAGALRTILERKGCDVEVALTLADGLRLIDRQPDYLILDLMLPDGLGTSLLRLTKERYPQVRVAVTTALSDAAELGRVQALSPYRVFYKPIHLVDLSSAMGMI